MIICQILGVSIGGQSPKDLSITALIICHLKAAARKDLVEFNCPLYLWDYCLERRVRINNLPAKELILLKGKTPHTTIYGCEGDISILSDFSWYEFETSVIIFEHVGNNYFQVLLGRSHVWIRPAMSEDGQEYYEYVLLWNDDCLDVSHQPEVFLLQEEIGEYIIQSTRGVYRSA